jgi:hypothetical protein
MIACHSLITSSEQGRASQVLLITITTNRRGDFHGFERTSSNIALPE